LNAHDLVKGRGTFKGRSPSPSRDRSHAVLMLRTMRTLLVIPRRSATPTTADTGLATR
jgi:hypothetical protein